MANGKWFDTYEEKMRVWLKNVVDNKVYGEIPIVSDIGYIMASLVTGISITAARAISDFVEGVINILFDVLDALFITPLNNEITKWLNWLISRELMDKKVSELYSQLAIETGDKGSLLHLVLNIMTILNIFGSIIEVSNVKTQQTMLAAIQPMLPQVEHLLRLLYIKPDISDAVKTLLHKYGYDNDMISLMKESNKGLLNVNDLKELYFRKELSRRDVTERLQLIGYDGEDANLISKLFEVIPSIQDLLYLVGKEAFEPQQIEEFGLADEFPEEQKGWLDKQGLSEYWQKKYWVAHWNYPSPQQVLEMLHRGKITPENVYEYYKVVEIPPYWRSKLMEISYKPYTRVDLRRMELLNIVKGEDALIEGYKEQGYDDEHATNMAKFTIKYNQRSKTSLTKSKVVDFYVKGILTEQDVLLALKDLDLDDIEIEYILRDADLKIKKEYIDTVIDSTESQYINNEINTGDVFRNLNSINMNAQKIEVYIEKWNVLKAKTRKYPSKDDCIKFYSNNIITEEKFYFMMSHLGYSDEYISMYLKLINKES